MFAMKMDNKAYFKSITQEMTALQNRVRHFILDKHWLSDGEWKESVLRSILRRNLPKSVGIGKGFVITQEGPSKQIDILLYDHSKPLLFQDGDFVLLTPDAVLGIIEVKTSLITSPLKEAITKLGQTNYFINKHTTSRPFTGLFVYEYQEVDWDELLEHVNTESQGQIRNSIHAFSLGTSHFAKHWQCPPETPRRPDPMWRAYKLDDMAPAYFIHNTIEYLCNISVNENSALWYPNEGKESHQITEVKMTRNT